MSSLQGACPHLSPLSVEHLSPHETCNQGSSGQRQLVPGWPPNLSPRPPVSALPGSQSGPALPRSCCFFYPGPFLVSRNPWCPSASGRTDGDEREAALQTLYVSRLARGRPGLAHRAASPGATLPGSWGRRQLLICSARKDTTASHSSHENIYEHDYVLY